MKWVCSGTHPPPRPAGPHCPGGRGGPAGRRVQPAVVPRRGPAGQRLQGRPSLRLGRGRRGGGGEPDGQAAATSPGDDEAAQRRQGEAPREENQRHPGSRLAES